jgi:hypothetical protein
MLFPQIDSVKTEVDGEECRNIDKSEIQGSFAALRMTTVLPMMQWVYEYCSGYPKGKS